MFHPYYQRPSFTPIPNHRQNVYNNQQHFWEEQEVSNSLLEEAGIN
jgi:hypothetical protein